MAKDAKSEVAADIVSLAEQISMLAVGLRAKDPALCARALDEASSIISDTQQGQIHDILGGIQAVAPGGTLEADGELLAIDDFIFQTLALTKQAMSVESLYNQSQEAGFDISRPHLVVKLNRLNESKKLERPERGHYRLSDSFRMRLNG